MTASASPPRASAWRTMLPWLLLAILVIVIDQATKTTIQDNLTYGQRIYVLPFFDLTLLYNPGAAFSFLAGAGGWQRWFFTLLGFAVAAFLLVQLYRHGNQKLSSTAMALLLGGALGNVIDRLLHGHVVDFLFFHYGDWWFPAFNLADSALTLGAILLIVDEILRMRRQRKVPA